MLVCLMHSAVARLPESVCVNGNVRYFAFGSNLLRSKMVGCVPTWSAQQPRVLTDSASGLPRCRRGETGVLDRVPALIRDHRLAFNLRMFPPLEPAMASIEPSAGDSCEGALYTLTREGYEELWRSEGGAMERPGYEELVVTAEASGESVSAITLRAASVGKL